MREDDGLAVSSRNKYLSAEQRKDAAQIFQSLSRCREMIEVGEKDASAIRAEMCGILGRVPAMEIEYVSIVDAGTLEEIERIGGRVLVAVAVRLGTARLIDNILVDTTR